MYIDCVNVDTDASRRQTECTPVYRTYAAINSEFSNFHAAFHFVCVNNTRFCCCFDFRAMEIEPRKVFPQMTCRFCFADNTKQEQRYL